MDIPDHTKMVRLDVKYFAFEVLLHSREKTYIKAVANVDPKLKFLPMSLINWICRKVIILAISQRLNFLLVSSRICLWIECLLKPDISR